MKCSRTAVPSAARRRPPRPNRARLAVLEARLAKKDAVIAEVSEEYLALKKKPGELNHQWVPPDLRDEVVDFVRAFSQRIERAVSWVLRQLAIAPTQYHRWTARYDSVNTHNGQIPRDHWLTAASDKRSWTITRRMRPRAIAGSRS